MPAVVGGSDPLNHTADGRVFEYGFDGGIQPFFTALFLRAKFTILFIVFSQGFRNLGDAVQLLLNAIEPFFITYGYLLATPFSFSMVRVPPNPCRQSNKVITRAGVCLGNC